MRVLITGMSGFAGTKLCEFLLRQTHWSIISLSSHAQGDRVSGRIQWWQLDMLDSDGLRRFMRFERPDLIFHLAAQASVPKSWTEPWETFEVNVHGTLNLMDAVVRAHLTPRILVVGSNEVYGAPAVASDLPFTEKSPLRPANPYGVSKVAQENLAMQYHYSHGLDLVVVRPFNHIGPGQKPGYVVSEFAKQIAEIETGQREPVMRVGNMTTQRDFTDVRDTVRAYYEVVRLVDSGVVLNVCSGMGRSIQSILDLMLSMSSTHIEVVSDPSKFRVLDTPLSYGDTSQIQATTGWRPEIPFEQTVTDILNYWRQKVSTQVMK